jgi:hypothetical protein
MLEATNVRAIALMMETATIPKQSLQNPVHCVSIHRPTVIHLWTTYPFKNVKQICNIMGQQQYKELCRSGGVLLLL